MKSTIAGMRNKTRRARRVRAKVRGTSERPRLSVFRSNRFLRAQLIDDAAGRTLASATDRDTGGTRKGKPMLRKERAAHVGSEIAARAKALGITRVRFDRGPYKYHGLVKAVADGARAAGLEY